MLSEGLERELDQSLLQRLLRGVASLEESLNGDMEAAFRLLREPIVHEELRIRRMRLGDYRVLFEILIDKCLVRILVVEHRRRVYRNLRRRRP
ncbi:MAG: type II toxin-antitoxin system RelE/ParE family toxin [Desulfurococcales archaeon]|nr:type II toxin-antitoxin system RelE/ParE family toxin [Desulfurococcales archaeon]